MTVERRTDRLTLRPLEDRDLDELIAIETDPATNAHRPSGPPSREEVGRHLASFVNAWNEVGVGYWAVEFGGFFIGVGGLRSFRFRARDAWNLYYRLRPNVWGQGLATEVAKEALVFAEELDPVLPVLARTRPSNVAAQRVAERAGMRRRQDLDDEGFQVYARGW